MALGSSAYTSCICHRLAVSGSGIRKHTANISVSWEKPHFGLPPRMLELQQLGFELGSRPRRRGSLQAQVDLAPGQSSQKAFRTLDVCGRVPASVLAASLNGGRAPWHPSLQPPKWWARARQVETGTPCR